MNILQEIFKQHYEEMLYILHPSQHVIETVDRMINCGDPAFGGAMYGCSRCGELKFVPFRCHTRFCPSCGNKYSMERTNSMSFKLIDCQHRHCVFTIPEELRHYFLKDHSLLNCLFSAVRSVVLRMFSKLSKSENFVPENGFYVRAKPNKCDPNIAIKYIGRYLGRPVISTKRIDNHDGENVTFHYNRHEDEKLVVETIPAVEFMKLLIQHIPDKNFKMIRYYGIYARQRDQDKKLRRAISKEKQRFFTSFTRWRDCILLSFGYDPLCCPKCKNTMSFLELYFNHKRVPLDEMYKKVMNKYKSHS